MRSITRKVALVAAGLLLAAPLAACSSSSSGGDSGTLSKDQYCTDMTPIWSGEDLPDPDVQDQAERDRVVGLIDTATSANSSSSVALGVMTQEEADSVNAALAALKKIYSGSAEAAQKALSAGSEEELIAALGLSQEEWDALQAEATDTATTKVEEFCGASAAPSESAS